MRKLEDDFENDEREKTERCRIRYKNKMLLAYNEETIRWSKVDIEELKNQTMLLHSI